MVAARTCLAVALAALLAAVVAGAPGGGATVGDRAVARLTGANTKPKRKAPVLRWLQKVQRRTVTRSVKAFPDDPLVPSSWALRTIRAEDAWRTTTGSAEVVVAVLDTGIDATHPDLAGALAPGWDAVDEDADPGDGHGHGTAVAGAIAARGDNGTGVAGVCWRCSIMPVRVIAADGHGTAADIAEGIRYATEHGARVVNLSFVLSAPDEAVADAIREARAHGVLVVAAAGNNAESDPVFPAAEPGVVSVGATDETDAAFAWSGHGPWVRVAAPGCVVTTATGAGYSTFCGTSAATAVVSGLAALAVSASPGASPDTIAATLEATAVPVGTAVASGRVDAAGALAALAPPAPPTDLLPRGLTG
jgi:subtilisin family serine protease